MSDDIEKLLENMRILKQLEEEAQKMIPSIEKIKQIKKEAEEYLMEDPCESLERNMDSFNQ